MIPAEETTLALDLIDEPENPSRETLDVERIGALADDIAANGLLQRIGVRGPSPEGRYRVAYGHRRLLALRTLNHSPVPVKCWPWQTDDRMLRISENNIRESLTAMEEAREVVGLLNTGIPLSAVARLMRRSVSWVGQRRDLLALPADVQEAIARDGLPLGVAVVLGDIDFAEYRASLLDEARRVGASVQTAELWRQHYLSDPKRIAGNYQTVQSLIEARETWVILAPCEACRQPVKLEELVTLRVDRECLAAILALIEREAAAAAET
ncbi:MAG TPA: ParB N-terminal domain-containing protein [Burkholderiales bacterium]